MAGITASYNTIFPIRFIISDVVIADVAGINPVDVSPQPLPNQRGQVKIEGTSVDNGFTWGFDVNGGYGQFPQDPTQNFYFRTGTNVNCTITTPVINQIRVDTPVADAGGRTYIFQFVPLQSFGPTVFQTSANVLTDDLRVKVTNYNLVF